MMSNDMALLRDYAARLAEPAFATLVSRHVALVHSAAFRQVNDPHLAEEITQAVFILLARKAASLGPDTILSAWLYRTTRYVARDALRTRRRRAQREQEAYMQSTLNEPHPGAWDQLAPLLDEAMGDLGERDRSALVLRFFENKSAPEIAATLNLNEDAAQKRVSRALEKLRKFFSKRGVVLSSAIIAAALSANSVQAAPASLAISATTVAAFKGAAASTSTLTLIKGALKIMAWTKIKTAAIVGIAVLLAAGATTVAVREVSARQQTTTWHPVTRIDSRQLEVPTNIVSLTPAKSKMAGSVWASQGKRMGFNQSLASVLASAYDVSENLIVDRDSLAADRYDYIVTVADHPSEAFQAEIKKQLGLVGRKETREAEILALKVARKDAPGLRPDSNPNGGYISNNGNSFQCKSQPIAILSKFLERILKMPVIDQTGLTGQYDISLKSTGPDPLSKSDPEALKQLVLDQLGLELTPTKQSVEMLIVEKVK